MRQAQRGSWLGQARVCKAAQSFQACSSLILSEQASGRRARAKWQGASGTPDGEQEGRARAGEAAGDESCSCSSGHQHGAKAPPGFNHVARPPAASRGRCEDAEGWGSRQAGPAEVARKPAVPAQPQNGLVAFRWVEGRSFGRDQGRCRVADPRLGLGSVGCACTEV